jgi:hypothetical protein
MFFIKGLLLDWAEVIIGWDIVFGLFELIMIVWDLSQTI